MEVISLILGIFKFLDQVKWLVQVLQKTPEERHQELMKTIQAEADNYAQTGRPTWN